MKITFSVDHRRAPAGVLLEIPSTQRRREAKREVERSGGLWQYPAVVRWNQVEPHLATGTYERLASGIPVTVNIPNTTWWPWFGYVG